MSPSFDVIEAETTHKKSILSPNFFFIYLFYLQFSLASSTSDLTVVSGVPGAVSELSDPIDIKTKLLSVSFEFMDRFKLQIDQIIIFYFILILGHWKVSEKSPKRSVPIVSWSWWLRATKRSLK